MGVTTDPGGTTHVGIKEMVGSYFQTALLRIDWRERCPPFTTATAPTTTHSTAVKTRNNVKMGTPDIAGGTKAEVPDEDDDLNTSLSRSDCRRP
jgi:hypothetical protein